MGKASLLTPVYFFSSIRAGSGKTTMLANLAVYLNNINQKIAIVDLDSDTPLKLKNTFPRSINLQEHSDISLTSQHQDSRYQKNFYFTETELISYFPAHRLADASMLFNDTTLRDFFIQITACFDTVMVNFPAGSTHCQKASELLARQHLWRGKSPVSIIVSQSDEKSLVSLDALIHENPAFFYQLQENTLLLFNRVPSSPEDQKLSDNTLNSLELRSLFNFPTTYVVGISEEFSYQRRAAAPQVLNDNSIMHQTISGLHRILTGTIRNLGRTLYESTSEYQACLDGQLLEKLSPYLENIQSAAASKLFQHPSNVQVFLEENEGNYRIRIRLTRVSQPLAGIQRAIPIKIKRQIKKKLSPAIWPFRQNFDLPLKADILVRKERPALSVKPVYRFDDRFASSTDFRLLCDFDMRPNQSRYPAPILFKPSLKTPDIPSLSEVLGYMRKQFKKCSFAPEKPPGVPGVTHFFIPPEFDIATRLKCIFVQQYIALLRPVRRSVLQHSREFMPACRLYERAVTLSSEIPDAFARNQAIANKHGFVPRVNCKIINEFIKKTNFPGKIAHTQPLIPSGKYLLRKTDIPTVDSCVIPPIIRLRASSLIELPPVKARAAAPRGRNWRDSFALRAVSDKNSIFCDNNSYDLKMLLSGIQTATIAELFKFTFASDVRAYKTAIFAKSAIPAPAIFAFHEAAPTRETYLGPVELKLPSSFKLEDVMVDHYFPQTLYKLAHTSSFSTEKISRLYNFSYPTFFKQKYLEPALKDTHKSFKADRADIRHKFVASGSDYNNLDYGYQKSRPALRNQVLQSSFKLKALKDYRDINSVKATRTDHVVDSKAARQKYSPVKGNITSIQFIPGRPPVLSQLPNNKQFDSSHSLTDHKLIFRLPSASKSPDKFVTDAAPYLVQTIKNCKPADNMSLPELYKCDSMHACSYRPVFVIYEPELYTLPARIGNRQIYHSVNTSLKDKIEITTMIEKTSYNYQQIYSEPFVEPVFMSKSLEHIASPLRIRKTELPQTLGFGDISAVGKAMDHETTIKFSANTKYTANYAKYFLPIKSEYRNLPIKKQSLIKPAAKFWKKLELAQKHFRATTPDPIETLYRHLLWTFAENRQQPAAYSSSHLATIDGSTKSFNIDRATIAANVTFCDKRTITTDKIPQKFSRKEVTVSKLSLKDIMTFAKQASAKFDQVNNRFRA